MLILSPEDRAILWRQATASDPDSREGLLRVLANEMQGILADKLDIYEGLDDQLESTLSLLDRSGLIGRDELRRAFEVTELEASDEIGISAAEFVLMLAGALEEASSFETLDAEARLAAHRLAATWREQVREDEDGVTPPDYLTVAAVASHFDVTPQAVYKWCARGKIAYDKTPGGSYRIPSGQFDWGRGEASRMARREIAGRLIAKYGADAQQDSEEEIVEAIRRARGDSTTD